MIECINQITKFALSPGFLPKAPQIGVSFQVSLNPDRSRPMKVGTSTTSFLRSSFVQAVRASLVCSISSSVLLPSQAVSQLWWCLHLLFCLPFYSLHLEKFTDNYKACVFMYLSVKSQWYRDVCLLVSCLTHSGPLTRQLVTQKSFCSLCTGSIYSLIAVSNFSWPVRCQNSVVTAVIRRNMSQ